MSAAIFFFFSSRRRHTRWPRDWSSDVCSSDLAQPLIEQGLIHIPYGGLWYAAQILTSSAVPGETRLVELTASIYPSESRIPNRVVTELSSEVGLVEGLILPSGAVRTRDRQGPRPHAR